MKRLKFLSKESYKHKLAIKVLADWLSVNYTVKIEESFITFRPDITTYTKNNIIAIYEVVHKNEITGKKLHEMQKWSYYNNIHLPVYEVDAEWILNKCEKPNYIKSIVFQL